MTFHVGQKVVCVDAANTRGELRLEAVYTVTAVGRQFGKAYIGLEETPSKFPLAWWAKRFRPVVEPKTDISVFTEILRRESNPRVMATSINNHDSNLNQI